VRACVWETNVTQTDLPQLSISSQQLAGVRACVCVCMETNVVADGDAYGWSPRRRCSSAVVCGVRVCARAETNGQMATAGHSLRLLILDHNWQACVRCACVCMGTTGRRCTGRPVPSIPCQQPAGVRVRVRMEPTHADMTHWSIDCRSSITNHSACVRAY
jgi:hypothetical protein